jgi:hypothetical protein
MEMLKSGRGSDARMAGTESTPGTGSRAAALLRADTLALLAVTAVGVGLLWLRLRGLYVDDAFIGFRYVDNLLAGRGFVFNPGDRVEGVTNSGWLLTLAPIAALIGPTAAAKLLGVALAATSALLAASILRAAAPAPEGPLGPFMPAIAAALVLSQAEFAYFTLTGMETGLLAALLLGAVRLSIGDRRPWLVAILAGLAFAAHPEAVLVYPIAVAGLVACRTASFGAALRRAVPFVAVIAAITLARWLYFGDLLPNTFAAKPVELGRVLRALLVVGDRPSSNLPFPFYGLFALPFLAAGIVLLGRRSMAAAALACGAVITAYLFAVYAAPDWTGMARHFAPYVPLGLTVALLGAMWIEARLWPARGTATAAIALAVAGLGIVNVAAQTGPARLATYPGYILAGAPLIEPSIWLRDNLPADAVIATRRIGAVAYVTGRRVFDYYLGLTDREVAARVRARGERFWSPADPDLADLWRARRPDYLLEDSDVIDRLIVETGGTAERFPLHGEVFQVVRRFPLGRRIEQTLFGLQETPIDWVLAARITNP